MKIWFGHGSEHSYSLVLVGYFTDETSARSAEQKFERLRVAAEKELPEIGWDADQRFTTGMRELLDTIKVWDLSRTDIENFAFEHTARRDGQTLRISTDEIEVQGFLKVLIGAGARVEIYSSHEWTEEGEARGEESQPGSGAGENGDESDIRSIGEIPGGEPPKGVDVPPASQESDAASGTTTEE